MSQVSFTNEVASNVFSDSERQTLEQEDLFAGNSVTRLFIAIVTGGTLLMLGTVLYTL